jgi:putative oxidoreductase
MNSDTTPDAHRRRLSARRNTLLWVAQILLAGFFLFAGGKVIGPPMAVHQFAKIGAAIGTGQWLRYFVGAAELSGAIGLVIPRLAGLAAAGLALDMAGASITNAVIFHNPGTTVLTVLLCILLAFIARSRGLTPWVHHENQSA